MITDLTKKLIDLGDPLAAQLLPDCRLQDRSSPNRARMIFCANCSKDSGKLFGSWVDNLDHFFYICNDCDAKHGPIGAPQVPDEFLVEKKHGE